MKTLVVLLLLPLALAHPGDSFGQQSDGWGWGGKAEKQEDKQKAMSQENVREMMQMVEQMFGGDGGRSGDHDDSHEKGEGMMGMSRGQLMEFVTVFYQMHGKKDESKEREDSGEEHDKQQYMEQFKKWMEMKQREMREKREREEREKKAMEEMYKKQMMVEKMGKLAEQFQEQKSKLVHAVVFEFLEFCKCQDTSAMMKRFFMHQFGDEAFMREWSMAMEDGGWDHDMMDDMKDMRDNMQNMQNRNGSDNTTFFGNNTMGNMTNTDGDGEHMDAETRAKWMMAAMKFSKMSHKEQASELFKGLVKGMCQRAGEYVAYVQRFERFYISWMKQMRNHRHY